MGIGYEGEVLNNHEPFAGKGANQADSAAAWSPSSKHAADEEISPVAEAVPQPPILKPIIMAFNIEALNADSSCTVIDRNQPVPSTDVPHSDCSKTGRTSFPGTPTGYIAVVHAKVSAVFPDEHRSAQT